MSNHFQLLLCKSFVIPSTPSNIPFEPPYAYRLAPNTDRSHLSHNVSSSAPTQGPLASPTAPVQLPKGMSHTSTPLLRSSAHTSGSWSHRPHRSGSCPNIPPLSCNPSPGYSLFQPVVASLSQLVLKTLVGLECSRSRFWT